MNIVLEGEFPNLNQEISHAKSHFAIYAKYKKEWTWMVELQCRTLPPIKEYPVSITFTWVTKNKRKDPDNVAFAKKYILDGLVHAGILENDSRKFIHSIQDFFATATNPYVIVEIKKV